MNQDNATIELHDRNGVVKAVTIIDSEDLPKLKGFNKWQLLPTGYVWTQKEKRVGGKRIRQHYALHRVIMNAPQGYDVDHINHDPLDNRKSNLRICTHLENGRNLVKSKANKSGYRGISWAKKDKRWHTYLNIKYKRVNIGYFKELDEAIKARKEAEIKYYGAFASEGVTT